MKAKVREPFAERIRAGLDEALAHARGELTLKTVVVPQDPPEIDADSLAAMRGSAGMSQSVFAGVLSVSPKTIQSWEQGKRKPSKAARRMIHLFAVQPEVVCRVVGLEPVTLAGFTVEPFGKGKWRIVKRLADTRSKTLPVPAREPVK